MNAEFSVSTDILWLLFSCCPLCCSSLALGGVGGRLVLTKKMPIRVPRNAGTKNAIFM